jgi:hypothetical protein
MLRKEEVGARNPVSINLSEHHQLCWLETLCNQRLFLASSGDLKLAALQYVARLRVRLDLHRGAPFLGSLTRSFSLLTQLLCCCETLQISCPTLRCRLSCWS